MTGAEMLALSIIGAMLTFVLKELGFGGARLISVLALVLLTLFAINGIGELLSALPFSAFGKESDAAKGIMKIIGVGYAFGICSDVCREIGENGVANAVLTLGRVEIMLISVPFVNSVFSVLTEFLK